MKLYLVISLRQNVCVTLEHMRQHYKAGIESHCYKWAPRLIDVITQDWESPNLFSTKTEYVQTCFRCENDPSCRYSLTQPRVPVSRVY